MRLCYNCPTRRPSRANHWIRRGHSDAPREFLCDHHYDEVPRGQIADEGTIEPLIEERETDYLWTP